MLFRYKVSRAFGIALGCCVVLLLSLNHINIKFFRNIAISDNTIIYSVKVSDVAQRVTEQSHLGGIHIGRNETCTWIYQQHGYLFNESGASQKLSVVLMSALVHDFTSYVSREARHRFVDPAGGNVFHVMSPAMTYRDGR